VSVEHHPNCQSCASEAEWAVNRRCPSCLPYPTGWACHPCGVWPCTCDTPFSPPVAPSPSERRDPRESSYGWGDEA
jgi:hypothetical protein